MSAIAAISTANASSGIGVIRISGDDAIEIADRVFSSVSGKKLREIKGYTALFGHVFDDTSVIDECVALVFRAPKSYTGENVVELSCHGGQVVTQLVLRAVLSAGAAAAEAGEFTKRAFLNGKLDLIKAESVMNVISAHGRQALNAAVNTLEGRLSEEIMSVSAALTTVSAAIAVWTDDPDEDVPDAHEENVAEALKAACKRLSVLLERFDSGSAVTQGISAVICGHTNVGKSTLMNMLAGCDRSIVTAVEGTTRDVVEDTVKVGDMVLRLADTAGIRQSDDLVEAIGIERSLKKINTAQLIIAVFDGSAKLSSDDFELLSRCKGRKAVAVINKADLNTVIDENIIRESIEDIIHMSAANGTGIDEFENVLKKLLGTGDIDTSCGLLANERQYNCCREAVTSLKEAVDGLNSGVTLDAVNVSIDYAIEKLLELTGEKARDAVVNEVFSKFCVGK